MSIEYINFNGKLVQSEEPVITVSNRGFRYGDGLFESMRYMKGDVKFAELHMDRLRKGMRMLKLEGYSQLDSYFLKEKAQELVRKNKIGANAKVRLIVYRNGAGLYTPDTNKAAFVMQVTKADHATYGEGRGLIVDVFNEHTKPVNPLSNLKTCNSMLFVLAGIFKSQYKLDEVIILNQSGFLCEALTSNVFVVYNKQIYTPALSEGCIGGVMRQVIMKLAKENNLPLIEAQISPEILNEAEEVFLTNASFGIRWVMGYNRKRYFNEISKFLTEKLNKL
jgi:branched-subunit amino acid aminotransferase/4-amino-4-deoxychorismate lyase